MMNRWRKIRAGWRDTLILLREFRTPLILFTIAVRGGGTAYHSVAEWVGEPPQSLSESIYIILTTSFMQYSGDFPNQISLQLFHFFMRLVGIVILALGLDEGEDPVLNRALGSKFWEGRVGAGMKNHIVLVG